MAGRIVTIDFTGAPPAQGGGTDRIPPGKYVLRLTKIDDGKSNTEKRMVTAALEVAQGPENGKRLRDQFVIGGDAKFGRQRLNAFFRALGLAVGEKIVKIDFDKLEGKLVLGDVRDDVIPANASYPERPISKVDAYFPVKESPNGTVTAAPAAPVAELPFEEPVEELTGGDDVDVQNAADAADALLN